ncbi:MAG: HAMP domain-containing sensor histidine kinase [Bacteroidota bacterium]
MREALLKYFSPNNLDNHPLKINIWWACIISEGLQFLIFLIDVIRVVLLAGKPMPFGTQRLVISMLLILIAFMANSKYSYRVSAFLFMLSPYLVFVVYPITPFYDNLIENLVLLTFLSLVTSIIPYMIYNLKQDAIWVVSWVLVIFITTFFSFKVTIDRMLEEDFAVLARQLLDQPIIPLAYFSTLAFLHGSLFYFKRNLEEQRDDIADKHQKLASHQTEILAQRDNLEELNEVKNRIFSIIAHDLRSPLNSLQSIISLFRTDGELSPHQLQELINKIGIKVQNVSALLNNLLYWAMSQMDAKLTMKPKYLQVRPFVQETWQLFAEAAEEKNIGLVAEVPRDLPPLLADEDALRLVLRNLMANAIKFTHPYGKVTLTAKHIPGAIRISVEDTGIGMTKEQIDNVIAGTVSQSVLGTKNEKGTGLGLLITKEFLERNGGTLSISSTPGENTHISFTLPLAPLQHPMASAPEFPASPQEKMPAPTLEV